MMRTIHFERVAASMVSLAVSAGAAVFAPEIRADEADGKPAAASQPAKPKPRLDHSGRKRVGEASIYSKKFAGQTMADGEKMDPHDDNAASKTLPLGTKAKVTNLETGQSAKVTIQDRGPYVKGRIVDLSPSTAKKIGLSKKEGVTKVEVKPIKVPMPDGSVKPESEIKRKDN